MHAVHYLLAGKRGANHDSRHEYLI